MANHAELHRTRRVCSLLALPDHAIITIALRPGDQLLSTSLALIPKGATLDNFRILLTETPFLRWVLNSTLIAFAVTATGVTRHQPAVMPSPGFDFSDAQKC
ncbi:MAG TPA: hypothetical protein VGM62_02520 [Chthoniobacterales bacterium]